MLELREGALSHGIVCSRTLVCVRVMMVVKWLPCGIFLGSHDVICAALSYMLVILWSSYRLVFFHFSPIIVYDYTLELNQRCIYMEVI